MTTILKGIVGSTAYGLDKPDSDIDRLGVFIVPTSQLHGLNPPNDKNSTHVYKEPSDYTEHELSKYIRLLLNCNPTVMELLWLPDDLYEVVTPEGLFLINLRKKFLSASKVRNVYLGYAMDQFHRLSERGNGTFSAQTKNRTEKHARHLMRLCWQGYQVYTTGELPIKVEDPESYHQFGRDVANDETLGQELIKKYELLFDSTVSILPEEPDRETIEAYLLEVRASHFDIQRYADLDPEKRALRYINYMVDSSIVNYNTVDQCQRALDNLTNGMKGIK